MTLSGGSTAMDPYKSMIYSDFMNSLRYGNDWYALIDPECYFSVYRKMIDHLLSKPAVKVNLAVLSDDVDTCLGWSMFEPNILHYIYVKADFRDQGIASSLAPKGFSSVSHLTKVGQSIRRTHFPDAVFNPFLT